MKQSPEYFAVGVIYTADILDRETTKSYWLTVYATDHGVVPLYTTIEVYIEVEDVNDNAPLTSEPIYYPAVMENSPKDVSVIQIQAQDPDSSTNEKLTYRITSGNPQNFFVINPKTGDAKGHTDNEWKWRQLVSYYSLAHLSGLNPSCIG
ncbi:protocadherin Fat 3 [Grus japonensis]|uniref:Protocadherin Fat 3 n=1 Tax=Grus japonensis TaxID=30415 RepID=A0ABC9W607_GRUJA